MKTGREPETETVTLSRADYDALIARQEELEDLLAAREADDESRIPHEVFLKIMDGGPRSCLARVSRYDVESAG